MALFAIGYDTNRIEVRENGLPCEVFMRSGANREIELYPIDEQESGLTIDDFLPGDTVMHDARHVAFIEVTGCLIAVPIP